MRCYFCEGGTDSRDCHQVCSAEYDRRFLAGNCMQCGAHMDRPDKWCPECDRLVDPPYVGYPPVIP